MFIMALCCAQANADALDLSFNSDALRLQYLHKFQSNINLDVGVLHHSDNGNVLHFGFHISDLASSGTNPITAGVGARLVYSNGDFSNQSGFAVPIGGYVRFSPKNANRLSIQGDVYFAPKVLSLGDAEKFEDYTFKIGYNIIRAVDIYVGARYVKGEYKNAASSLYDNGMNIGINWRFQ
jgi:hypothetical protein